MSAAPILLFTYNRTSHVKQILISLETNPLFAKSPLYVFSDFGTTVDDQKKVRSVREYLKLYPWHQKPKFMFASVHKGLRQSIIQGISKAFKSYDRVIVLEDDLIVSSGFLQFMNDVLEKYANLQRIMSISGYMYPIKTDDLPEVITYAQPSSWGWATWNRAWKYYTDDPKQLFNQIYRSKRIKEFNIENGNDFLSDLKKNMTGELNTWAIRWYASMFIRHGLSVYPKKSLVNNMGFDGSGTNCDTTSIYFHSQLGIQNAVTEVPLYENLTMRSRMHKFYVKQNNILHKVRTKIKNII